MDLVFAKYKATRSEPLFPALGPVPGMRSPTVLVPGWGLGWVPGHSGPSWAESMCVYTCGGLWVWGLPGSVLVLLGLRQYWYLEKCLCKVESLFLWGPQCNVQVWL